MRHLGIDIGGSSVKVSLLDDAPSILHGSIMPLEDVPDPLLNRAARVEVVARAIAEHERDEALSVTIAAPGIVDAPHRRIVSLPGKLTGLEGLDWSQALQRASATVLNDGHAAVLGELQLGAGRGARDVVMLTLGTGVGGGVAIGGRLFEGSNRRAGHLGHISLDPDGAPSVFPTPGSLEWHVGDAYVGERTLGRYASTEALLAGVGRAEPGAIEAWRRTVRALAVGIASLVNAFDPERVVLGGGVAKAGRLLFEPLSDELDAVEWRPNGLRVPVVPAALGRYSGSVGAALFGRARARGERSTT